MTYLVNDMGMQELEHLIPTSDNTVISNATIQKLKLVDISSASRTCHDVGGNRLYVGDSDKKVVDA